LGGNDTAQLEHQYTKYTEMGSPKLNLSAMFVIALAAIINNKSQSDESAMCAATYMQLLGEYTKICGTIHTSEDYINAKKKANKAIKEKLRADREKRKHKLKREGEREGESLDDGDG
jgi:hypothetical protein